MQGFFTFFEIGIIALSRQLLYLVHGIYGKGVRGHMVEGGRGMAPSVSDPTCARTTRTHHTYILM